MWNVEHPSRVALRVDGQAQPINRVKLERPILMEELTCACQAR